MPEYWIQLENHWWDVSPNNIDRMTGLQIQAIPGNAPPVVKALTSPVTGVATNRTMYKPLPEEALILRRYTANWAAPDDRKVNPWDLNEPDPTDSGTMGTIPGPTIECRVGESVTVHFRNMDMRPLPVERRTHSLHTHGFAFAREADGAYPLTTPDPAQPIPPGAAAAWAAVGVTGPSKQGDRVPPGEDFTYTWNTFGWPTTAGVWLYHDHSICADDNIEHGAIGLVVIHNDTDPQDLPEADVEANWPGGSALNGPCYLVCLPFPPSPPIGILPHQRSALVRAETGASRTGQEPATGQPPETPTAAPALDLEGLHLETNDELDRIIRFCLPFFRPPPEKAQYLQLFHSLAGVGMCINGRKYLGNTPTMVAGPDTTMRFGVVGMGSDFHTFHLHGHRWVIPGPNGADPGTIQNSAQVTAVSQFEDTRAFGPANSFVFTIDESAARGSFFRAEPSIGEWHMHCHVIGHMMDGMMGSLLVVRGGELCLGLPHGVPCPMGGGGVNIMDNFFSPSNITIPHGQAVQWTNMGSSHTVTSNPGSFSCSPASSESFDSGVLAGGGTFSHTFNTPGTFAYHCEIHGCTMAGTVTVT
jgi:plastocyanin/FtsP/CotA-like multicopper oxidase with cupredoxin domain